MKIKKQEEATDFKPFDLVITIETRGEAALLWHVLNHGNLRHRLLVDNPGYNNSSPSRYSYENAAPKFNISPDEYNKLLKEYI